MADHNDNRALEPGSEEHQSNEMASWVQLQHQEFELQRQEFNLRQQEAMGNLEYAREALKVESEDRNGQRVADNERHKRTTISITIVILAVISFGVLLVMKENADLLEELIKLLVVLFGGYGWGYHQGRKHRLDGGQRNTDS